jgi:hypothetical protein
MIRTAGEAGAWIGVVHVVRGKDLLFGETTFVGNEMLDIGCGSLMLTFMLLDIDVNFGLENTFGVVGS